MILKRINILLLFFIISTIPLISLAQGEFETSRGPDDYIAHTFGIKLNSNGFGGHYDFSKRITYRLRRFYEVEYNFVKDPKEMKFTVSYLSSYTTRRYIYGKVNSVHNIRAGYGINRMIFEKRDKNSISIHLLGAVGGTLCFSKPIYYEIVDSVINNEIYSSEKKFESLQDPAILGKAPVKLGFSEIKLHPGLYAKFGLAFDFSRDVMKTSILEVGTGFEYYFREIEIIADNPHNYFFTLYLSYNFGRKYDARLDRDYRKEQRKKERKNPE